MEKMETTCIMCPMGCSLSIEKVGDEIVVTGNTCPRGKIYGANEFTAPKRVVTTLVRLEGGGVASCKTAGLIPKEMMGDILRELKKVVLKRPVHIGDVVIHDILSTGVDVVATMERL